MSRSKWKIPYVSNVFFSNLFKKKRIMSLKQRQSVIPGSFLNKGLRIYNGIWFLKINVKSNMIGHKFGEFSFTKRFGRQVPKRGRKSSRKNK